MVFPSFFTDISFGFTSEQAGERNVKRMRKGNESVLCNEKKNSEFTVETENLHPTAEGMKKWDVGVEGEGGCLQWSIRKLQVLEECGSSSQQVEVSGTPEGGFMFGMKVTFKHWSHFSIFYNKPHSERTRSAIFNESCRSDSPLRIRVESAGIIWHTVRKWKQDDPQEEFKFSQSVDNKMTQTTNTVKCVC